MKKSFRASFILALAVLMLSSCSSTGGRYGYGDGRTPEEIQLSLEILMADSFREAPGFIDITEDEIRSLLPSSLSEYRDTLPLYDELEDAYMEAALSGMEEAVREAIELLEEQKMPVPWTDDYINERTLADEMRDTLRENVVTMMEERIPALFPEMAEAWRKLETECTILKRNYDNLSSVTAMPALAAPEAISDRTLAEYITSEALDAFSFAEEYLRNRPLTDQSERSYQIFWEEY